MSDPLSHILNTSVNDGLLSATHASTRLVTLALDVAKARPAGRKSLVAGLERELRKRRKPDYQAQLVAAFNGLHPIGTRVRAWPGSFSDAPIETVTRSEAQLLSGHTAVVWLENVAGCIAIEHVEVVR